MSLFHRQVITECRPSTTGAGTVVLDARLSPKPARFGLGNVLAARLRWTLGAAMAGLVACGCGSPVAVLEINAPSSAHAGSPFTVTVTVMASGRRDTIFNSPIHFTSSDRAAVLPPDYTFTAADAGSHTFTNAVTLMTAGSQTIVATDPNAPSITATANVTVTAVPAAR
jgi:trimeric autotransporter adhesin